VARGEVRHNADPDQHSDNDENRPIRRDGIHEERRIEHVGERGDVKARRVNNKFGYDTKNGDVAVIYSRVTLEGYRFILLIVAHFLTL
jgi:hypothetical protein